MKKRLQTQRNDPLNHRKYKSEQLNELVSDVHFFIIFLD